MRSVLGYAGVLVPLFGPFLNHTLLAATTDSCILSAPASAHSNPAPTGTPSESAASGHGNRAALPAENLCSGKESPIPGKKKKMDILILLWLVFHRAGGYQTNCEALESYWGACKALCEPTNDWQLSHSWKGLHTEVAELITPMQMNLKKNCHCLVNTKTPGCQVWLDKMAFHPPWHIDCTHSTWDTEPSADKEEYDGCLRFCCGYVKDAGENFCCLPDKCY